MGVNTGAEILARHRCEYTGEELIALKEMKSNEQPPNGVRQAYL